MTKKVQVIINPAAGGDTPILNVLNTVFLENGVEWDVSITHRAGDARQAARQAVQGGADVVAAYGGDGTVTEAANGLRGTEIPLAILPGGTANVLARELNIPLGLADAARLASGVESKIDRIDLGQMGEHIFLLRVGIGFEAAMV
ncbi:MAG: diacylglycerol kinase family protein, partial [Caldilineaceae bacterium]